MKSMTGFGKAESHTKDLHLDVSVKAVNGRYLDIKFHGPKIYNALEMEIRKKVAKKVRRGTFDIYVNRKSFAGTEKINFNEKLAKKWMQGFQSMAKSLNLEEPKQAEILLQVPDLISVDENASLSTKEKTQLFSTIDKALSACDKVRSEEGKALKKDLEIYISQLKKLGNKVEKLKEQTLKGLKLKYEQRLKKLGMPEDIDEQRFAQEVVVLIDKSDISEELHRLTTHLSAIKKLLQDNGSIGKKLDFYAQELLREVNTIGSKSTSADLTGVVVEAKSAIEKYREQVQNVE